MSDQVEHLVTCPYCQEEYPEDALGQLDIWGCIDGEFLCHIDGDWNIICRGCEESIEHHGSIFIYFDETDEYKVMFDGSLYIDYGYDCFDTNYEPINTKSHEILKAVMKNTEGHYQFYRGATTTENSDQLKEVFYIASVYLHQQEEKFIEAMREYMIDIKMSYVEVYNRTSNVLSTILQFFCKAEDYHFTLNVARGFKKHYDATSINLR